MKQGLRIKKNGFTLIELLVVIAIIGVLSALLMVNFIGIRQRARDATRKSDMRQIQSALELYRSDQGSYPSSLPTCGTAFSFGTTTYLQKMPCDPLGPTPYASCFYGSGTNYALRTCLENSNDSQKDATSNQAITGCSFTPAISCASGTTSFTLQNP